MTQLKTAQDKLNIEIMELFEKIYDTEWLDFSYGMGKKINRSVDCHVKEVLIEMGYNLKYGPNFDMLDEQMDQLKDLIGDN